MSYNYQVQKKELFTEDGQRILLAVRDEVHRLLEEAGAFMMQRAWRTCGGGDSWTFLAAVDRLVELGEIVELERRCAGQHRVFVKVGGP